MFATRLTRPQQIALLSLARELVAADSVAAVGEVAAIAGLEREMGLDPSTPIEWPAATVAAGRLDSSAARTVALIELIALGHADGRFTMPENAVVQRLAVLWRIDSSRLAALEEWVLRHRRLMHEGTRLISGREPAESPDR